MNECPSAGARHIAALAELAAALPTGDRVRFDRLFHLAVSVGQTVPPKSMHPWIEKHFGSVEAVCHQQIIRVTNRVTLEGAQFNALRASRPVEAPAEDLDLEDTIGRHVGDPFCHPLEGTPADTFGRVRGQHAVTASNVAKYDAWHGVVIFDEHHPLRLRADYVADYLDTAQAWARAAHRADPDARYPLFIWNCLWRSGASILHGHAQMILTRGMHFAKVEAWRQAALRYRAAYGGPYFDDLVAVSRALGLVVDRGSAAIFPTLTPIKEKETHIVAPHLDGDMKEALYLVLRTFLDRLAVRSFNLAVYLPPLGPVEEDWSGFPVIARLIDRGPLDSKTSDLGAMELFASSVVTTDPFRVASALCEAEAATRGETEP